MKLSNHYNETLAGYKKINCLLLYYRRCLKR